MRNGVTISPADGGFIIMWLEARKSEESKGFDVHESDPIDRAMLRAPVRREAVRTSIEEALKLVGKILKDGRLAIGDEGDAYIAGA